MNDSSSRRDHAYLVRPIGHVQQTDTGCRLIVDEPFRAGLKQLDQFSHVVVLWWADRHDSAQDRAVVETTLPYAPGVTAGVFACRSEYRPNPVLMTVTRAWSNYGSMAWMGPRCSI